MNRYDEFTSKHCSTKRRYRTLSEDDRQMMVRHNLPLACHANAIFAIEDDRILAGLPWKNDVSLPNNYSVALRRLLSVECKFRKDPKFASSYSKVIQDYEDNGFFRAVSPSEPASPGKIWYLPHHGITNPMKPGTVRVVFDASAEYRGSSLNNSLLSGPNLESAQILTAFRLSTVGISIDIQTFFHSIKVSPEDQTSLRYLWRPPG